MQKIFTKLKIFTKVKSQVGENEIKFPKWKMIFKKKIQKCHRRKSWLGLKKQNQPKNFLKS